MRRLPLFGALACALAGVVAPAFAGAALAVTLAVTLPTVTVTPGATVDLPITTNASPAGLGITSIDFRATLDPTWVQSAQLLPGGMVATWGAPFTNVSTSAFAVAAAGGTAISDTSRRVATLRVVLKPGVPLGTDLTLAFEHFWFNEGNPGANTTAGLIRVRSGSTGVGDAPGTAFALAAPFPSPARRATRLAFELPVASRGAVRLAIHDAAGRRVRTLVDSPLAAGRHSVAWDLRDDGGTAVRPGAYFVRLECDSGVRWRRLTVLD